MAMGLSYRGDSRENVTLAPSTEGGNYKENNMTKIYMVRCPKCGKENWAPAVADGQCAWCGYKAKESDVNGGSVFK